MRRMMNPVGSNPTLPFCLVRFTLRGGNPMKKFVCVALFALLLLAVPASAQTFSSRTLHFEQTTTVDPGVTADAGVLPYAAPACGGSAASFRGLTGYTAGGTCGGGAVAAFDPRLTGYAVAPGCGASTLPAFGLGTRAFFDPRVAGYGVGGVGFRARGFGAFADPFVGVAPFVNVNVNNGLFGGRFGVRNHGLGSLGFGGVGRGFIGPRFHGAGHAVGHVHARARLRF
jgi:hypothetical protein